jgi:small GTP-binding protein
MDSVTTIKIITLGDSSVGKTSVLLRFTENTFSPTMMSTVGIDSKTRTVTFADRSYRVQVWDTAGQEKFRTISYTFYSRADGILLVYDVTDPNSLQHVTSWMAQIRERAKKDVAITLIGNKTDLADSQDFSSGERLASTYNIKFFPTSAKTGTNIEDAFMSLVSDSVTKNPGVASANSDRIQVVSDPVPRHSEGGCCGGKK